jgi:hypothetical protein
MFYVYHGFVNSDNYDASEGPVYRLTECETEEDILDLKADHDVNLTGESGHAIFRVIEGKERELEPREVVTSWKLVNKIA